MGSLGHGEGHGGHGFNLGHVVGDVITHGIIDSLHHHDPFYLTHGLHVGVVVGAPHYYDYPYYGPYVVAPRPVVVRPSRRQSPTVVTRGAGRVGEDLLVERLEGGVVRLTWRDGGDRIAEVALFLADAEQKVLAVQTLRSAPFRALFESAAGAVYAGVTIVYTDGVKSTTLLPFDPNRRG